MQNELDNFLIGLVGPCAAGKTTIRALLSAEGLRVKHIAQEHSYAQSMWQIITHPDILIFLDVSYPITIERRHLNWTKEDYQEQQHRLTHARQHADLYIQTDSLTPPETAQRILNFIIKWKSQLTTSNSTF